MSRLTLSNLSRNTFLSIVYPSLHPPHFEVHGKKVTILTIPKAGTGLIFALPDALKLTRHFSEPYHLMNEIYASVYGKFVEGQIGVHLDLKEKVFNQDRHFIVLIRDPRAVLLSLKNYLPKLGFQVDPKKNPDFLLSKVLDRSFPKEVVAHLATSFNAACEIVEQLDELDNVTLIRYEDLVGAKGGGDDEVQLETIKKIVKVFGFSFEDSEIKDLAKKIYGGSATFTTGKIDTWKTAYKPEHITLFKKNWNSVLLRLGYEQDPNWDVQYL